MIISVVRKQAQNMWVFVRVFGVVQWSIFAVLLIAFAVCIGRKASLSTSYFENITQFNSNRQSP